ncbi:hypothetical protein BsIDN1_12420 [Bacillus safensis]|uniref:Uncharacterized protein n=1 Tax=Bacillus safensis TaxID=561879 RepID=A0A5S9M637_BACIA|nr:hypothetical protein BsIDN1_12420 [Bacillus safensis]
MARTSINSKKKKWENGGLAPLDLSYDLTMSDLQFSMPLGVKMRNAVIMEPYTVEIDNSINQLSCDHDQSFFSLIDRKGEWRVNTMLKGFANKKCRALSAHFRSRVIF